MRTYAMDVGIMEWITSISDDKKVYYRYCEDMHTMVNRFLVQRLSK